MMLNLFHGWMQEMGGPPPIQRGASPRGLYVGPIPAPKAPPSLAESAYNQLVDILVTREGSKEELRSLMVCLPAVCRQKLLEYVYEYSPDPGYTAELPAAVPPQLTRSRYFHLVDSSLGVLYGEDWTEVIVPDVRATLMTRKDIVIDSPSREEDVARVLRRLGLHTLKHMDRPPDCHMTHADLYTAMFKTISEAGPSRVNTLVLKQYANRNVQSVRELQGIFNMIAQMPRLVHIELGYGTNDAILWRIAKTCGSLRMLKISGNDVTDKGLFWLTGHNLDLKEDDFIFQNDDICSTQHSTIDQTKAEYRLSSSLQHLNISGALHVTETAVRQCWTTFRNLVVFGVQESHLWLILEEIAGLELYDQFILPIRSIELTTSSRHNNLTGAARAFPDLRELIIWNFGSEFSSPFQGFDGWISFKKLEALKLNNLAFQDLQIILRDIGGQLKLIDIDNFSIEESPHSCVSLHELGMVCPHLEELYLTMVQCSLSAPHQNLFGNLHTLSIKGGSFEKDTVLGNLILSTKKLQHLTVYHKSIESSLHPLDDTSMVKLISAKVLSDLRTFHATAIDTDNHAHLALGEDTLFSLAQNCKNLEKVGNLAKWSIFDMDRTMATLRLVFNWTRIIKDQ